MSRKSSKTYWNVLRATKTDTILIKWLGWILQVSHYNCVTNHLAGGTFFKHKYKHQFMRTTIFRFGLNPNFKKTICQILSLLSNVQHKVCTTKVTMYILWEPNFRFTEEKISNICLAAVAAQLYTINNTRRSSPQSF